MGQILRPTESHEIAVRLVQDEIDALVAEAVAVGGLLSIGAHAERLAETYPAAEMSPAQIANAIVLAAVNSGVGAMKIDRSEPAAAQSLATP